MNNISNISWADFICCACNKPIKGHKVMKMHGKHYHPTCCINIVFHKNEVKQ